MSYVQLATVAPLESVSRIVSLPTAELPLKVNVVEMVEEKPPLLIAQSIENVHVAELTFVVHPEPPSTGAEPLSPEIVSLPLITIVWSWMGGQFIPPDSAVRCCVYVPEVIEQGPPVPPVPSSPPLDVEPPHARSVKPSQQPIV
jgi:hypothetical protein